MSTVRSHDRDPCRHGRNQQHELVERCAYAAARTLHERGSGYAGKMFENRVFHDAAAPNSITLTPASASRHSLRGVQSPPAGDACRALPGLWPPSGGDGLSLRR